MRATTTWARRRIRRRLLGLVAVGILAGVAGAAVMGPIAGARRAATAFDRYQEATDAPNALVSPSGEDVFGRGDAIDQFAKLPGVAGSSRLSTLVMRPVGTDFEPFGNQLVVGSRDRHFGVDEARFNIVAGRTFDQRRADEAVVTDSMARLLGVKPGDTLHLESWSPAFLTSLSNGTPPPDGPRVTVKVVGITHDFGALTAFAPESIFLTAAFTRHWEGRIAPLYSLLLVRLEGGPHGYRAYSAAVDKLGRRLHGEWDVSPNDAHVAQVAGAIDVQKLGLLAFAAVAAAAALAVVFAALARQLSFLAADQDALRAIGMTPRLRAAGIVLVAAPAAIVGAATSVGLTYATSGLLPLGTPGRLDPDAGLRTAPLVLGVGGVAVLVVVLALAAVAAVSLTRMLPSRAGSGRPVPLATAGWLPRPASLGIQLAVEHGRGARALPTRSTLAGSVIGVGGVIAALMFGGSLTHLTSTPRLYGWKADALVGVGTDSSGAHRVDQTLEADPRIKDLATVVWADLQIDGHPRTGGAIVEPVRGDPFDVVVAGRTPRAGNEISMGRAVADDLGVDIGDSVSIALADGTSANFDVVGIVANPPGLQGSHREQYVVLGTDVNRFRAADSLPFYGAVVTFGDGVNRSEVIADYRTKGLSFIGPQRPQSVANLDEISGIPDVLALFFGILGIAFVIHALVTGVQRRGRDLAITKALGFSPGQLRTTITTQATTVAIVSICVGVPLGLVVGRAAWSVVAGRLGVPLELVTSWPILVAVLGILVVANVAALAPGHRAAHLHAASELRET